VGAGAFHYSESIAPECYIRKAPIDGKVPTFPGLPGKKPAPLDYRGRYVSVRLSTVLGPPGPARLKARQIASAGDPIDARLMMFPFSAISLISISKTNCLHSNLIAALRHKFTTPKRLHVSAIGGNRLGRPEAAGRPSIDFPHYRPNTAAQTIPTVRLRSMIPVRVSRVGRNGVLVFSLTPPV